MKWLGIAAVALLAFILNANWTKGRWQNVAVVFADRVVVSAPVQVVLYGGDRFLAADVEAIRASVTGMDIGTVNLGYLSRAQNVASELNPCHEDNYYTANALLTLAGADRQAVGILERAISCRFWDEMPPFYLGFNQHFFHGNYADAQRNLQLAASRSTIRTTSFTKLAIMIKAESFKNERMALEFLTEEKDKTRDAKLRALLEVRADRIKGLLRLRDAQAIYEARFGKKLENPGQLMENGIIQAFPIDPMKIGYRFKNGEFHLNELAMQ
ncbi:MAG: hypothetical protein KJ787_12020 [Gammaproteobacteria bacterium]|nr:hypothetical protein [Gammaproteobacteria bacterium]MBU1647049.1 hypothetical protein [Gammaproteobacteria bacterium]MBU1972561.1 hypothetical protein [Gammaproteobacteria bacterium]